MGATPAMDKWTGSFDMAASAAKQFLIADSVADKTLTQATSFTVPDGYSQQIITRDLGPYEHVGCLVRIKPLTGTMPNWTDKNVHVNFGITPEIFDNVWDTQANVAMGAIHSELVIGTQQKTMKASQLVQTNSDIGKWWSIAFTPTDTTVSNGRGAWPRIGVFLEMTPTASATFTSELEVYFVYA